MISRPELSKLTTGQKREYARLLLLKQSEIESRKIDFYKPHKGQLPFHKSQAKVRCLTGGNQSGKSVSGCIESIWFALGVHPYRKVSVPNVGRIVSAQGFQTGIKQVILPKIYEWIPKEMIARDRKNQQGIINYIEFNNGSVVHLMSGDQDMDSFEGATLDWAYFDEPIQRDIYIATLRGLIRHEGSCWLCMTPMSEPWIYDEIWIKGKTKESLDINGKIYDNMTTESFVINTWDNWDKNGGYLKEKEIAFFANGLSADEKKTRIDGEFMLLSGLVYKNFDADFHVIAPLEWPEHYPVYRAIDPHVNKPHHVVWVGISEDETLVCLEELKVECSLPDLAQLILERDKKYNIVASLIDPAINVNDGIYRVNQREVLERAGLRLRFPCKRDNLVPGIMEIQRLLTKVDGKAKLYVVNTCTNLIHEFMRYQWDDNGSPKKKFDDSLDALRYIVISNPRYEYERKVSRWKNHSAVMNSYGYV